MMVSIPEPPLLAPDGRLCGRHEGAEEHPRPQKMDHDDPRKAGENVASRRIALLRVQEVYPKFRRASDAQATFFRRRHQPSTPPLAKIRPGSPEPAMGPGTAEGESVPNAYSNWKPLEIWLAVKA
jgi:hypothetical protein